eukprot:CAMPEP_0179001986 /NCGR_PEP_ID=MMETSP0795-20121207/11715_1 /TAXON_ID=88552 /ORGANISM="Amoebophrya sp., Strain Ameob2" /LENGTH=106 /DNA_ID=CAMNT_0020695521 /DNA_START=714 /DNA_END=1034 /DNA_ORIENTATION=-
MSSRDLFISMEKQARMGMKNWLKQQQTSIGESQRKNGTPPAEDGNGKPQSLPAGDIAALTMSPHVTHADRFLTFDHIRGQGPLGLRGYHNWVQDGIHGGRKTGDFF